MNPFLEALGWLIYHSLQIVEKPWFPYALAGWLGVAVLSDALQGWKFFRNLASLMQAEWIFSLCSRAEVVDPSKVPERKSKEILFYPRDLLEQISCALKEFFTWPLKEVVVPTVQEIAQKLYPFETPGHSVSHAFIAVFFGVFLTLFAYGDSIAIANGLDALGLIRGTIPTFLLYYEIAIGVATFLAIVVGFFEFFRSFGSEDEVEGEGAKQKVKVRRSLSLLIIVIGITTSAFLGVGRIMALGYWENSEWLRLLVQIGINVLTLVNGIMAAALVFEEGLEGYRVLLSLFSYGIAGVLLVIDVVLFGGIRLLLFSVDIFWRAAYIVIGLPLFFTFAPLVAIVKMIIKFFVNIAHLIKNMFGG